MATVLGFLGNFGKAKINDAQKGILQKLVAWDPQGASEAEINGILKDLDTISLQAGEAHALYEKEKKEADAARANYNRYVGAAEKLNEQFEAEEDIPKKDELRKSLENLLKKLEELLPDVEREEKEAVEAEQDFKSLKEFAETVATKAKNARSALANAQRDVERADLEKKRAEERAGRAEVMAGLKQDSGSLGIAMTAMQEEAAKKRAAAEAAGMKADLLGKSEGEDKNVEAALKAVDGTKDTTSMSPAERLAALKK